MDILQLKNILIEEKEELTKLLELLDEQFNFIVKNDVFGLEGLVKKIEKQGAAVARVEVKRRNITQGLGMSSTLKDVKDKETLHLFEEVKKLVEELELQKDSNNLLIKQQLVYVNNLLSMGKVDNRPRTYTSYGRVR